MADLYRAGFETRRDALRVSAYREARHPPSPGLAWRNTTFGYTSPPGVRHVHTWQVGADVDAEDEAVDLTYTLSAGAVATKSVTIDDDETQSFVWSPASPTLKEGGMAPVTLSAPPRRRGGEGSKRES